MIRKGSVPYVYEIISRKNCKTHKEKVVCVGIAIDNVNMYPNEKYYELHKESINTKPLPEPKNI